MRREPEPDNTATADRDGPEVPVVYGLPTFEQFEAAERGEVTLGGCCPPPGWVDDAPSANDDHESDGTRWDPPLIDGGEGFDDLPTDSVALTSLAVREAEAVERRADDVAGLVVMSRGLLEAADRCALDPAITDRVARLSAIVQGAADRAAEANGIAHRTLAHLLDLVEASDDPNDDRLYEDVLTARLHVPIAESIVEDAVSDASPALRDLARLCLAAAGPPLRDPPLEELHRRARGGLRLDLPGVTSRLATEHPELRSATTDDLPLEVAGLLAHALLEHRTYLILDNTRRGNRYVQAITFDRGVYLESIGDEYLLDRPLNAVEIDRLVDLGWQAPDPDGNWHRKVLDPVDPIAVATMLIRTLVELHDLTDPDDLTLTIEPTVDPFGERMTMTPTATTAGRDCGGNQ